MTTPEGPDARQPADGEQPPVDLGKKDGASGSEAPFDPYRFGKPDHPIPPEYAPPGYVPDTPLAQPPPGVYPPPPQAGGPYAPYPGPPYGGSSYPPPPYGAGPGYAPPRGNGKAVTALVCGIAGIVFCWLSFFALLVIVPAFVFGFLALNESKSRGGSGRGLAVAGIACAVVAALLTTVLTVLVFRAADKCGGLENSDDPGFQQCVQDNFL